MQRGLTPLFSHLPVLHGRRLALLGVALLGLALAAPLGAATFHVDAEAGDDSNDGTSPTTPWRTVTRVNETTCQPGDQVLFHAGQIHVGNLVLTQADSGTAASPVVVSSYGAGRATLYAATGDGITLLDTSYVTLSDLNIAGPGWHSVNDGSRGVVLSGSAHQCIVEHLTVSGFHKAGVRTESNTRDNAITFVTAEQNGFIGIHVSGDYQLVSDCKALYNHGDVTVTNNWSGSGILVDDASYVMVEYSEAAYNGTHQPWTGNGPVGIWCWNADHVTFRHCISHDNKRGKGNADGGGFDLDGGTTYSLVEHCYSYNNTGPGFMVYNFKWQNIPNRNNVIRYCISENDGQGGVFLGTSGVALENIEIYGVVAFNTNGARVLYNSSGTKKNVNLRNNVFVTSGKLTINGNGINLQGNCYYSSSGSYGFGSYGNNFEGWAAATGDEMHNGTLIGLKTDPQLHDVGYGAKLTEPRQLGTLRSYSAISEGSPVINAGLDLPGLFGVDPGTSDIIGAAVPIDAFDMGAFEYHPAPPLDATPPTLTLTNPLEGAVVSGMLLVSAEVVDEPAGSGVAGVQFQLDGVTLGDDVTESPYSILCDTTALENGLHTLTAIARDLTGNSAAASVSITVDNAPPDTTPPTIAFSAPTDGSTVTGTVTLSAEVADEPDGSGVVGVQFLLDGANLGDELTVAPYSTSWDTTNATNGTHVLTAVARDAAGNVTTAEPLLVTVDNPTLLLGPITQDNADANGVVVTGSWISSTSVTGYHGTNYLAATAGDRGVCFTPTMPQTGLYDVYLRWTSHTNRATNAPVEVAHADGTTTFSINMRSGGGMWVLLGTFTFEAGTTGTVAVRANGANGYVVADAVQFVPR